jgi:hypothetical protein
MNKGGFGSPYFFLCFKFKEDIIGISLELVNFNTLFRQGSRKEKLIINDFDNTSTEQRKIFDKIIYTEYDNADLLSNLPTCECGHLYGQHLEHVTCTVCNSEVLAPLEQDLEPVVWMRSPNGVADLINPSAWAMMSKRFERQSFDFVRFFADRDYRPNVKDPDALPEVLSWGIPRGYNSFVENFDILMNLFFESKHFRLRKGERDDFRILLERYRDCFFCEFLPLPNRSVLVIEKTNVGKYVDDTIPGVIDAIYTMIGIDAPMSGHSVRVKENRTIKTIIQLNDFSEQTIRKKLAKKPGVFRKHVYGTRTHFSFRAVISSNTNAHDYDELHLPWGVAVNLLNLHLRNKLDKMGYTPNEALAFLNEYSLKYHPVLDALFQELIAESPYVGLPVVFQRNPSLERGSIQFMFVTKVKPDAGVTTVSLSILSVVGFNADFDGDQLNGTLLLDNYTAEEMKALAPHKSVFDMNTPRAPSRNSSMPKPVVATIAHWYHLDEDHVYDPEKARLMDDIPTLSD